MKKKLVFLGKLVVSLGLIIYLATLIDWPRAITTIRSANLPLLLLAPFISLISFLIAGGVRWRLILLDNGVDFPLWQAFRGYLLGLFYGTFLPGVLGGDAVRVAVCVQRTKCSVGTATAAVLLERVSGVVSLFTILFMVYLFSPSTAAALLSFENTQIITLLALAGILGLILVLSTRSIWLRWAPKPEAKGLAAFIRSMMMTLGTIKVKTMFFVMATAVLFQAFDILTAFVISRAIGLNTPLTVFFGIIPLVYLALMVPISLGGLGVREGTMVFLLSHFNVGASEAVTLSFLIYINRLLVGGIWGGGWQLLETLLQKKKLSEPKSQVDFKH